MTTNPSVRLLSLIDLGLLLHEARQYRDALPFFEEALFARCPNAAYNMANTLQMLDEELRLEFAPRAKSVMD